MDIFLLYLWTRLDAITVALSFLLFAGVVTVILSCITWSAKYRKEEQENGKVFTWQVAKYTLILLIALIVIPTQKDAAIIAGGWAVKQVATSEGAQKLSSKTFALINGKLDEELAKLKKETK